MSKFSKEHHVKCPYEKTVSLVKDFLRENGFRKNLSTEITPLMAKEFVDDAEDTEYAVIQSSNPEWTIIVSNYDYSLDESLTEYISKQWGCTTLYGHNNDQTDNWKWIHFEKGEKVGTYHCVGQEWYRFPENHKKEALDLWEMFAKMGTPYQHYSFTEAISVAKRGTLIRVKGY